MQVVLAYIHVHFPCYMYRVLFMFMFIQLHPWPGYCSCGQAFDVGRLQARILAETKLHMKVEEKPLYDAEPKLVLKRDFGV